MLSTLFLHFLVEFAHLSLLSTIMHLLQENKGSLVNINTVSAKVTLTIIH